MISPLFQITVLPVARVMEVGSSRLAWNWPLDLRAFHVPWVARLTSRPGLPRVRRGRVLHRHLRRQHITLDERNTPLRPTGEQGAARGQRPAGMDRQAVQTALVARGGWKIATRAARPTFTGTARHSNVPRPRTAATRSRSIGSTG